MEAAIEQYTLSETYDDTLNMPLSLPYTLHSSCLHMQVRSGSKAKNLVQFAMRKLFPSADNSTNVEQVTWNGFGDGISKAIACAEITKRRSAITFYEHVQIGYKRIEQIWQPVRTTSLELDTLKVNKDLPAISILLSKIPLSTMNKEDN